MLSVLAVGAGYSDYIVGVRRKVRLYTRSWVYIVVSERGDSGEVETVCSGAPQVCVREGAESLGDEVSYL
jgi:hypothetical protein